MIYSANKKTKTKKMEETGVPEVEEGKEAAVADDFGMAWNSQMAKCGAAEVEVSVICSNRWS